MRRTILTFDVDDSLCVDTQISLCLLTRLAESVTHTLVVPNDFVVFGLQHRDQMCDNQVVQVCSSQVAVSSSRHHPANLAFKAQNAHVESAAPKVVCEHGSAVFFHSGACESVRGEQVGHGSSSGLINDLQHLRINKQLSARLHHRGLQLHSKHRRPLW